MNGKKTDVEIERRFVVRNIDPDFKRGAEEIEIRQGYLPSYDPLSVLRVRIMDGKKAVVTYKAGRGMTREEREHEIPLEAARLLLEGCGGHILEKKRFVRDGWEVDEFRGPLAGLMLAEFEMESEDQNVPFPAWLGEHIEVTDSLTNEHLAQLAADLDGDAPAGPVYELVGKRLPKLVLTGGPCSGKSTALRELEGLHGNSAHFVPEAATIVFGQLKVGAPDGKRDTWHFQRLLAQVQRNFERISEIHALRSGKKALILDRGTVDAAAYLEGGIAEFEKALKTSIAREYEQYDRVVWLNQPPEEVYDRHCQDNPVRRETFAAAVGVSQRLHDAWSGHPSFMDIHESSWKEKSVMVHTYVIGFLENAKSR